MKIRIGKLKKYFLTKVIGSLEIYFSKVGRLCAKTQKANNHNLNYPENI